MSNTQALKLALTLIEQDRRALLESHAYPPGSLTIPASDPAADEALAQYDEAIHAIRTALAQPQPSVPTDALAEMEARKDAAYLERNQVVAALAKAYPSGVARTAIEGWSEDWHGCVYIDLPTGQASWHFHDSQAYLFDGLPAYAGKWDGHDTPEKYRRLATLKPQASVPSAEPILWQYRWTNPGDNPNTDPAELEWKIVAVRNLHMETIESRIKELSGYTYNGRPAYEVRPLYAVPTPLPATAPEAQAPAVQPLTDVQWLKLRTAKTGERLRRNHDERAKAEFLGWMRFAENVYGITLAGIAAAPTKETP